MTAKKYITFDELIALAKQHYNHGGDGVVECWDQATFETWVKMFGPMTKKQALSIIRAE